jgi:uncharacterized protein YggL (DUF469 family)
MAKTAQQRFNEYLDEREATRQVVGAFERAVHEKYDGSGYAYIAGYFMMQMLDAVSELPKARRQEFRALFQREAKKFEQENLMKTIKDTA